MARNVVLRFFVADDAEAQKHIAKLLAGRDAHDQMLEGLKQRLRVHGLQLNADRMPVGVLFEEHHVAPKGCAYHAKHKIGGKTYIEYRPSMKRRSGMEVYRLMASVGRFNASGYIIKQYNVDNSVLTQDGKSLIFSVAGVYNGKIVFKIPEDDLHKVPIPPSLREISEAMMMNLTGEHVG